MFYSYDVQVSPIPMNPPPSFFNSNEIPDVGDVMLASFPSDPNFASSIPADSWWIGEKYDGIRCCWNPFTKTLYSRSAKEIEIPKAFSDKFPNSFVDAEIWFGRGQYLSAQNMLQDFHFNNFAFLRFVAFDDPSKDVQRNPFEHRYEHLLSKLIFSHPFFTIAPRVMCKNRKHLSTSVQSILGNGGEGVILQARKSQYENGRSSILLKLKAAQGDMEALVVDVNEMTGSVVIELANGKVVVVPVQRVLLEDLPVKGDVITMAYDISSRKSVPIRPHLTRIRKDLSWRDVLAQHAHEVQVKQLNEYSEVNFTHTSRRYWTSSKGKNMRLFLETLARQNNLDPLLPHSWYNFPRKLIKDSPGGSTILGHFKGGFVKNIMALFPEIGLDENKFSDYTNSSMHWMDVLKRRKYFSEFAKERKFDPLVADHWYSITAEKLMEPEAKAILQHYSGNLVKALNHIFPEIGLDPKKFVPIHRKYFESFAAVKGLDFNRPETWYSISLATYFSWKRGKRILSYYNYDLYETLRVLFPEMAINSKKCPNTKKYWSMECNRWAYLTTLQLQSDASKRSYWSLKSSRRQFFNDFANDKNFDANDVSQWYSVSKDSLLSFKGARNILYYYDNFAQALVDLFPLPWNESSLSHLNRADKNIWSDVDARKEFMINYARDKNFDPFNASDWYKITKHDFTSVRGASRVLSYYGNSLSKALVALFPELQLDSSNFLFTKTYWEDKNKRVLILERFATQNSMDPLVAENWYPIELHQITSVPGGNKLLSMYDRSLYSALVDLFPSVHFEKQKFYYIRHYWEDKDNQRKLFSQFASANDFDPLVNHNWYQVPISKLLLVKGGPKVLEQYNNSLPNALTNLFPTIPFNPADFTTNKSYDSTSEWKQTVKKFFCDFASEYKFDPFIPANWYNYTRISEYLPFKGVHAVLRYYKNLPSALMDVFPNIGLDLTKFNSSERNNWDSKANRRIAFENFAKENNFNPLVAKNWYKIPKDKIIQYKGVSSIMMYYNSSVIKALQDLFPEVKFDESKFSVIPRNYWNETIHRRKYFEEIASTNNFDALVAENWYPVQRDNLLFSLQNGKYVNFKGSKNILDHHGTFSKALIDLFPDVAFEKEKFQFL